MQDSLFNFTHAHLIRNMVTATELDLVRREPCDKDLILIAFYPTGGFGDYIISAKLLDEILLSEPCRIDVYCEHLEFGQAVYAARPGVQVFPYDMLHASRSIYDVVLCVEHFILVWNYNAHHTAKISPAFADRIRQLGVNLRRIRPAIEQQCYREAMHFHRNQLLGINRWGELRQGDVFEIPDQHSYVALGHAGYEQMSELGLQGVQYITVNRGADSMGRSTMQTKVWPKEHYEKLIALCKDKYPDLLVIQLGTKQNTKLQGADRYVLGESMETTKWILRNSLLHIDCEGGLVHLATQLAVKCIVLFGPTPLHTYAYQDNINLVSDKCSNCMGTHEDWAFSCYRGMKEPECMYSLTPELVLPYIEEHIGRLSCPAGKRIMQRAPDTAVSETDMAQFYKEYALYKKKNHLLTMDKAYGGLYAAVMRQAGNLHAGAKIAVVNAGRDFIGWHLQAKGYEVVEFDSTYGYSGQRGDVSFNLFTKRCIAQGMDMRLGCSLQLPYDADSVDMAVWFVQKQQEPEGKREILRIMKDNGFLVCYSS